MMLKIFWLILFKQLFLLRLETNLLFPSNLKTTVVLFYMFFSFLFFPLSFEGCKSLCLLLRNE